MPDRETQDVIAAKVFAALHERAKVIRAANAVWAKTLDEITAALCSKAPNGFVEVAEDEDFDVFSLDGVRAKLKGLPPIITDKSAQDDQDDDLFSML